MMGPDAQSTGARRLPEIAVWFENEGLFLNVNHLLVPSVLDNKADVVFTRKVHACNGICGRGNIDGITDVISLNALVVTRCVWVAACVLLVGGCKTGRVNKSEF
jgi:hypothetical protein